MDTLTQAGVVLKRHADQQMQATNDVPGQR